MLGFIILTILATIFIPPIGVIMWFFALMGSRVWDVITGILCILLTIIAGPIACIATLPILAWCVICFIGLTMNKKGN